MLVTVTVTATELKEMDVNADQLKQCVSESFDGGLTSMDMDGVIYLNGVSVDVQVTE